MPDDPNPTPQPTPTPAPTPAPSPTPEPSPAPEERFVPAARFDAVVGQKYEAIRKAEGLEARARELEGRIAQFEQQRTNAQQATQTQQTQTDAGTRTFQAPISPAELDRLADIRARQMRFNERCNDSVATGRKTYADFDAKVDDLRKVAPTVDAQGRPMLPETLVSAALATGRAHEVLYALGSDQSEADRIMSIGDPTSQAVAVAQYAAGLAKTKAEGESGDDQAVPPKRATEVPAPIRQVVGGSRKVSVKDMDLDDPALPIEEFMRRRDEEAKVARRANGRFR